MPHHWQGLDSGHTPSLAKGSAQVWVSDEVLLWDVLQDVTFTFHYCRSQSVSEV